ncbi:MAG: hypothetical protein P0116_00820 [Candidatus Nitrosocosmicus sp.]|nr:hypothetical protein [Candidatus Nitrosocosmicus sp.]
MSGNPISSVALIIMGLLGLSVGSLFSRSHWGIANVGSNRDLGTINTANDISILSAIIIMLLLNGNRNHTGEITNNFGISKTWGSRLGFATILKTSLTGYFQNEQNKLNSYLISSNDSLNTFSETTKVNDVECSDYIGACAIPVKTYL